MGQRSSNLEAFEMDISDNKWKMFQLTQYKNLKPGGKYKLLCGHFVFVAIFWSYQDEFHNECDYYENCDASFIEIKKFINMLQVDQSWTFYKFIPQKEYMAKLREKYNETVLNIVLKRLINDDFKW